VLDKQGGTIVMLSPAPEAPGGGAPTARGARIVITLPTGDKVAQGEAVTEAVAPGD
jgi:hypothetical protein